ncbi:MAG: helix-turn-helix domain-containing protein, partial [Kiritimatiellae bacterium]|nr:helix-turn-helix domain-containing protein [Kiritimatiellia bacterium]
ELSDGKPPAYSVVSNTVERRWARERIDAFCACCRGAGFDCPLAVFPEADVPRDTPPAKSLVSWAASLPPHCAVFAVNDLCAHNVAKALVAAGRPFPRTVTLVGADGVEPPQAADQTIPAMVSSVVLDHEMAGYLAAKMIGEEASRRAAEEAEPQSNKENLRASTLSAALRESSTFPPLLVARRQSTRGRGRREPRILEAMEMIRREACDGLTAAALAARFPGTRRLFDLRFREAIGQPPLDEILNIRLERAMELLVHADSPISVVASQCGFPSEWEFWHFFRKRTGMPPLRFRRERR